MAPSFFLDKLYPVQDAALRLIREANTGFYLSGGTAASRGYLQHRFSEDLDLFVNDRQEFSLWADEVLERFSRVASWQRQVLQKEERFVRFEIRSADVVLRIELVNDVPSHAGEIIDHPILGRLDSAENILANKVTAVIDRDEPKDLADIWGFCTKMSLSLSAAIEGAQGKAAGIFPADLARTLCTVTGEDWESILWIQAPPAEQFLSDLRRLGEALIL
jgi:hypothetical protein